MFKYRLTQLLLLKFPENYPICMLKKSIQLSDWNTYNFRKFISHMLHLNAQFSHVSVDPVTFLLYKLLHLYQGSRDNKTMQTNYLNFKITIIVNYTSSEE